MTDSQVEKEAAIRVAITASIALAIMLVEYVWLLRDEVKYVWSKLRVSRDAWIYMIARYVGLVSQIYNFYFTLRMYFGVHTSYHGCRIWFLYQEFVVQLLLLFAEALLMQRVYALFLRNSLILALLVLCALGQLAAMCISARLSFVGNKHTMTCLMLKSNPGSAFFSATTMTTNTIIFFMTFWRFFRLPKNWVQHGLGRVVLRDSALSLSAITVIMLFLTLCALEVIKPKTSGNLTYYWLVTVLWVSVGRLVVNHEKIPRDGAEQPASDTWRGTLQLTSLIELGESTWSVGSTDGRALSSRTLQTSLSTTKTSAGQLSPSSVPSKSSRKWFGREHGLHAQPCGKSPSHDVCTSDCGQPSPQPSSTAVSTEGSLRPSASKVCTSDVGTPSQRSSQQPSTPLSTEASTLPPSSPSACTGDDDVPKTEERAQADQDSDGRTHPTLRSSPSSRSGSPRLEVQSLS